MARQSLKRFFAEQRYSSVEEVLRQCEHLSREIPRIERKQPAPITFSAKQLRQISARSDRLALVAEIAPKFLTHYYSHAEIALALLKRQGNPSPSPEQIRKTMTLLSRDLTDLVKRGLIPRSSHRLPALQRATQADIEEHRHLVGRVWRRGHPFLRAYMRRVLTREEAEQAGLRGLIRGIETFNEKKGEKIPYLAGRIAGAISQDARAALRMAQRMQAQVSLREAEVERTEPPQRHAREVVEHLQLLLSNRRARAHYVAVYVLTNVFGYSSEEIARHFGVTGQAVRNAHKFARNILIKELQSKVSS